jgi:protease-4
MSRWALPGQGLETSQAARDRRSAIFFGPQEKSWIPPNPQQRSRLGAQNAGKACLFALDEQRAAGAGVYFFKFLGFAYLARCTFAVVDWGTGVEHQERHTALINLNGVIQTKGEANAENMVAACNSAFEGKNVAGFILRINSPGGSPVQAGMINDEIASACVASIRKSPFMWWSRTCAPPGGYYVAVAADKIYVNKASIVGSIGVLMDGFGIYRHDGQTRRRAPPADGRRKQGFSRSILAPGART